MRFKGLDLNLLLALDVLLDEKSVSRSAERLHLSQPAMSAALRRLREYFNDPILKQHGKRMVSTPHALIIHQELKVVLASVEALISKTAFFDPATTSRKFTITASDYLAQVIFVPLIRNLRNLAPNIQLEIVPPADSTHELLSQGSIDLVILPEQMISDEFPSELLFEDRFVIVGCQSNPVFTQAMTEEAFYTSGHVVVKLGNRRPISVSDQQLEARKKSRDTDILISSFLLAPEMVVGTDRLTVMHERLANIFATRVPIVTAPLPFSFPSIKEHVQVHSARSNDPGIQYILQKIKEAAITKTNPNT